MGMPINHLIEAQTKVRKHEGQVLEQALLWVEGRSQTNEEWLKAMSAFHKALGDLIMASYDAGKASMEVVYGQK